MCTNYIIVKKFPQVCFFSLLLRVAVLANRFRADEVEWSVVVASPRGWKGELSANKQIVVIGREEGRGEDRDKYIER